MTRNPISRNSVLNLCSEYEKVTGWSPLSKTRKRTVTIPRQCLFYILRKKCGMSYSSIGQIFDCNHATVIHGSRVTENSIYIKDMDTLNVVSIWIDILENIMPNNMQVMFSTQDRIYSALESTLLNNQSKIAVLQDILKKYEETTLV